LLEHLDPLVPIVFYQLALQVQVYLGLVALLELVPLVAWQVPLLFVVLWVRLLFFVHARRIDMIEFHIDQFRLSSF
jgi:hypothetical protein